MNLTKKIAILIGSAGLVAGAAGAAAMQIHAAGSTSALASGGMGQVMQQHERPTAAGTIQSVNGTSFTLTDKHTNTTYTVDASSASIVQVTEPSVQGQQPVKTAISVSDLKVGDFVAVQGTVSGTSISATSVDDGAMGFGRGRGRGGTAGTVSAINGSTVTVTGRDGQTYTVDGSAATVQQIADSSLANIKVGDTVMVQGTVSGNSVTAKHIVDGQMPEPEQNQQQFQQQ